MTDTKSADATLKATLRADLTASMKARDTLTTGTLRMALAAITNAEVAVRSGYLPTQLTDAEIAELVAKAVQDVSASTGAPVAMRQMGVVIKQVQAAAAGRADGSKIAAA